MALRIMYIGEIVGKAGVFCVKKLLPRLRKELRVDFVVACADGATGGSGVGKSHSVYLRKLGIDVLTTGEGAFYKKDIVEAFPKEPWLLRPANYPPGVPGRGYRVYRAGEAPVGVVTLLGQSGFPRTHLENPFNVLPEIVARLKETTPVVLLDFHAATTAEKVAMAVHADGQVSAVIGSHARTLAADARVSAAGTAAITDAGRTGSSLSVGGMDPGMRVNEYRTGIPVWAKECLAAPELQGCVVEIGPDGRAVGIETLRIPCEEALHEGTGERFWRLRTAR